MEHRTVLMPGAAVAAPWIARRALIALASAEVAAVAPLARAQTGGAKVCRIGSLSFEPLTAPLAQAMRGAFAAGMQELGFAAGRDYTMVRVSADRQPEHVASAAAELVAARADVILTATTRLAMAAKSATSTIPIVMVFVSDPMASRLVRSFAHPRGIPHWHCRLRYGTGEQAHPAAARGGAASGPSGRAGQPRLPGLQAGHCGGRHHRAAPQLATREGRGAAAVGSHGSDGADSGSALRRLHSRQWRDYSLGLGRNRWLARLLIPNVSIGTYARQGAMLSYCSDIVREFRQATGLVARIVKGEKLADMPIAQVKKLELIVNLKAAKQIGLTIPHSLRLRADEVIE